jgi:hypothetical protein
MTKDWIINRAIVSLVQQRIISPFDEASAKEILIEVFQAAYETKRRDKNTYKLKPCAKYLDGKCIETYASITEAAQKNGKNRKGIWRRLNKLQVDRHEWRYL